MFEICLDSRIQKSEFFNYWGSRTWCKPFGGCLRPRHQKTIGGLRALHRRRTRDCCKPSCLRSRSRGPPTTPIPLVGRDLMSRGDGSPVPRFRTRIKRASTFGGNRCSGVTHMQHIKRVGELRRSAAELSLLSQSVTTPAIRSRLSREATELLYTADQLARVSQPPERSKLPRRL